MGLVSQFKLKIFTDVLESFSVKHIVDVIDEFGKKYFGDSKSKFNEDVSRKLIAIAVELNKRG